MAVTIQQFRFYQENSGDNFPSGSKMKDFISGSVFESTGVNYYPILQLGIQTLPGTKFYVNNGLEPLYIGNTGIYELNLDNRAEISKLTFDGTSMQLINDSEQGYLIVDILYDNGGVE